MKTLEIFDPGQCCTKDTCCHGGHSLLRIDAITDQLRGMGIEVTRHTLNYDPPGFHAQCAGQPDVADKGCGGAAYHTRRRRHCSHGRISHDTTVQ
jgi:hypothetical protein